MVINFNMPYSSKTNTELFTLIFTILTSLIGCAQNTLVAPNSGASAIDQHTINSNGCGPVAQLNAYNFSSEKWRKKTDLIPGKTPGKRFEYLVLKYGNRFSRHVHGRMRWSPRRGMSSPDLLDYINDFHSVARLPRLKLDSAFLKDKETQFQLLQRTHRQMKKSMEKGFPPIIDLRRFAKKTSQGGHMWRSVFGHFVTVYSIPNHLGPDATAIPIKYIDPSGGRIKIGSISIPKTNFFANDATNRTDLKLRKSPCLEANFPQTSVGKKYIKKGEKNILILSSIIGDF